MKTAIVWIMFMMGVFMSGADAGGIVFPLHIGDHWGYTFSGVCDNQLISIIARDTTIGGKSYAVFFNNSVYGTAMSRYDGQRVMGFDAVTQKEYTVFDFSAAAGETLSTRSNETWIALGAMTFLRSTAGAQYTFTVKDSIGVIKMTSSANPCIMSLTNALIEGKVLYPTAVTDGPALPSEQILLLHSYPNPFNPTATIRYFLPQRDAVRLDVISLQGQIVATLREETEEKGWHETTWNAAGAPSGAYFLRLTTTDKSRVIKLMLMK